MKFYLPCFTITIVAIALSHADPITAAYVCHARMRFTIFVN